VFPSFSRALVAASQHSPAVEFLKILVGVPWKQKPGNPLALSAVHCFGQFFGGLTISVSQNHAP
jgi:hypothetical protein